MILFVFKCLHMMVSNNIGQHVEEDKQERKKKKFVAKIEGETIAIFI